MNAMRAGRYRANAAACTALATSSIQYWMTSVTTATPTSSDDATSIATASSSTVRLGKRSAATPPHGVASEHDEAEGQQHAAEAGVAAR